ncbi:MAG: class I adenylate-forming enzyme family protein [Halobacteria archaeon]
MFGPLLERYAKYIPADTCLVHGERRVTWGDLDRRASALARGLREMGVGRGDKGALLFRNSPEFLEANFALQKLGAIPVPLNYRYVAPELEYVVSNSDAKVLLLEEEFLPEVQRANLKVERVVRASGVKVPGGFRDYESLMRPGPFRSRVPKTATGVILYTGGTTGMPKGVVLTYEHFLRDVDKVARAMNAFLTPLGKGGKAESEFQRRISRALESRLGAFAKALKDPEMAGLPVTIDQDPQKMTLKIEDGKFRIYRGRPEGPHIYIFQRGNIPEEVGKLQTFLWSKSRMAKVKQMGRVLRGAVTGQYKIRPRKAGLRYLRLMRQHALAERTISHLFLGPPFFHGAGYAAMASWIISGEGVLVLPKSASFDPAEVVHAVREHHLHGLLLVPTMWKRLLDHLEREPVDAGSVVTALSGAALLPSETKKRILRAFPNALVVDVFGQTEMSPATSIQVDGDPEQVRERCVGFGLPGIEVSIRDADGREVPAGQTGEIWYKSDTVMDGYYKDAERTARVLKEGWFRSGDLGWRDADGRIYTVERVQECINSGGEKVYPLEVEEVLVKHPAVQEACVIAFPHPDWGESVRAVVQLKPGARASPDELMAWCQGKMAGYKKPRSVVFAESLPITPVGKIQRGKVREIYGKPPAGPGNGGNPAS